MNELVEIWCVKTGTFAASFYGCCCYGHAVWLGPIVVKLAWKRKVYQYSAVLWSSMVQCILCAAEKPYQRPCMSVKIKPFQWKEWHLSCLQSFCFCKWNFCDDFQPSGGSFGCTQAPDHTIINFTLTWHAPLLSNSTCRLLRKLCKPTGARWRLQHWKLSWTLQLSRLKATFLPLWCFLHMFCLFLAVPFVMDALLSVCWCECNTNTVWNYLNVLDWRKTSFFFLYIMYWWYLVFFNGFKKVCMLLFCTCN